MSAIDAKWEFSDAQTVAGTTGDVRSTNVVNLGDLSISYPQIGNLFLNCILTTGFTSCTSIDVILNKGSGVDATPDINAGEYEVMSCIIVHADRGLATTASDGRVLVSQAIPLGIVDQYLQVVYTMASGVGNAVIDCWMGLAPINQVINIQESPA